MQSCCFFRVARASAFRKESIAQAAGALEQQRGRQGAWWPSRRATLPTRPLPWTTRHPQSLPAPRRSRRSVQVSYTVADTAAGSSCRVPGAARRLGSRHCRAGRRSGTRARKQPGHMAICMSCWRASSISISARLCSARRLAGPQRSRPDPCLVLAASKACAATRSPDTAGTVAGPR